MGYWNHIGEASMSSKRLLRLGIAVAALALLLTSIGSASAARARSAPHAPTTLVIGATEEPDTLNPNVTQLTTTFDVLAGTCQDLLSNDAHGNYIPDLATSWSVSRDGLTYTFHLRHGVRWSDGAPFTSQDVLFTYKQIINPKNNTYTTTGWTNISSVQVPDKYTIIFHTKKVFAPFLNDVGLDNAIMPEHYFMHSPSFLKNGNFNHDPYNQQPMGTGPYKVVQWAHGDHITLVPNPYYWGQKPYFQKIIYKIVPSPNTLLVQLRTNEIQLTGNVGITQQQVELARHIPGKTLVVTTGQSWYHIDLKQWGFLLDQKVRVALDYATPKDEILKTVLHGYGQIDNGDIAPISPYYDPNTPRHLFNLATAASLLASDGFKKGSDGFLQKGGRDLYIQLWYNSDDTAGAQIMEILKYEWGQIGVKVDLHHEDINTIYGASGPQFTKQETGIAYAWTNTGADPDDSFYWNSSQIPSSPTGAGGNAISYFHKLNFQKQIDDLTNAGLVTTNFAKRKAIYDQIQVLLAQQDPVIFLDWQPGLFVEPSNFKGFAPNAFVSLLWNAQQWHY
jgi:peptide/nickel transport system substrate-binding protein